MNKVAYEDFLKGVKRGRFERIKRSAIEARAGLKFINEKKGRRRKNS